ncbi:MAG: hypothetical protein VW683_03420 [Betaproteobacteria bacterium]
METEELSADKILDIILRLPPSANRNQVCDLIVNVVMAYQMRDDFPIIMLNVANVLMQIDDVENISIH